MTACAHKTVLVPMPPAGSEAASSAATADQRWSGRLALKLSAFGQDGPQGVNVAFDLLGNPRRGQLDLSTPLGTLVAQVRWHEAVATMTTADGSETYDSLDALTRQVLGESLPVAAMMSWLQGHPADASTWRRQDANAIPPAQFKEAGWDIDLRELDQGTLLAQRAQTPERRGATLRVKLDR